jgi:hypothetical protein
MSEIQQLIKALELGSMNAAPSTLSQGSSLQMEDLSPVLHNLTFQDNHIKLQKSLSVKEAKGQMIQFVRQLDYGTFGGSAQYEGGIGQDNTASYQRATVPMSYYSTNARASIAANMASTFDGVKAEDRVENDAEKKLVGDIEFDLFRGQDDFSNAGLFDGNPLAVAKVPNMVGVIPQVRASDAQSNTQDLMFAEYGSDQSIEISVNGNLGQANIEDSAVRSAMNMGSADALTLDPISLSNYNKIAFAKERIILAGAAQEASGANLRKQWTSSAMVELEASRFLSGKTRPARSSSGAPSAPAISGAISATSAIIAAGDYIYYVTAVNEIGESVPSAQYAATGVTLGDQVTLTITNVSGAKSYNVYRSSTNGSLASCKFIGKVKASASASTSFVDLGNRRPGSVTALLSQKDTMAIHQLAGLTKMKLAVTDLSLPSAVFRFLCVATYQPRKNAILSNIEGGI